MASIMKRGNTYSVRYNYKDHAGKPCKGWETFKTKAEAQERKITVEKELLDGTFLVPDTMTVEEMLYKWIPIQSSKHKWSPKTYTQSVAMVQNLIVPYIGKRKVQDLRTYDIEQFYATLSQTPCGQYVHGEKQELTENQKKRLLSSTSIHEVHTLLKTAFSYAVDWDLIHKSPTPRDHSVAWKCCVFYFFSNCPSHDDTSSLYSRGFSTWCIWEVSARTASLECFTAIW